METNTSKIIFTGTVESQGDFQIELDNSEITYEDIVTSLSTIEISRASINELHYNMQTLQEYLNKFALKSQKHQATLEQCLNMEKVDNPFEHFTTIIDAYSSLIVCSSKFMEILDEQISLELQNVDPFYADMSKDIDRVQKNIAVVFAQFGEKLLQETGLKIEDANSNSLNDMLEDIRGEFDQLKEECKEMRSEMVELCEKQCEACLSCFQLYDAKISDVLDKDLACLVAQSKELSRICENYHVQAKDVINKELLASDGVKKQFVESINTYLTGYKRAYGMQRDEGINAKNTLKKMADIVKDPSAYVTVYDSKGRKIHKEKKELTETQKSNLSKIAEADKQIDNDMNTVRKNYKNDSNEVKTRADAISMSFQDKF